MVIHDVPPFCNASGDRARLRGLNLVGLRRRGMTAEQIGPIKRAYRILFVSGERFDDARARVAAELGGNPEVERMLEFLAASKRGVTKAARARGGADDAEDGEEGA
jgi:UDP-N-acetylglucosamine acyltransferase